MYISTKTYCHSVGLSCCFRQHRAKSHCRFLHGYALEVRVEFAAFVLDQNNWVIDFGSLKSFRTTLEQHFDHKTIVAEDDPDIDMFTMLEKHGLARLTMVKATGCEAFAELIYTLAQQWLIENNQWSRVKVARVEVSEHGGNSAIYTEHVPTEMLRNELYGG